MTGPQKRRMSIFLSTLSLRRATPADLQIRAALDISIHALLAESDGALLRVVLVQQVFLSTLSLRRATNDLVTSCQAKHISIHALLAESDGRVLGRGRGLPVFLSTLSLRRATTRSYTRPYRSVSFLSTLSLRRATAVTCMCIVRQTISIHALLAESDDSLQRSCERVHISIHALLAESDALPGWWTAGPAISIHALLAESDEISLIRPYAYFAFLSTLSLRRATLDAVESHYHEYSISIHALLAESDDSKERIIKALQNFYPRSPCGERPKESNRPE